MKLTTPTLLSFALLLGSLPAFAVDHLATIGQTIDDLSAAD